MNTIPMCYHCFPFHSSLGIHIDLRKGEEGHKANSEKKGEGEEKACHSGQ